MTMMEIRKGAATSFGEVGLSPYPLYSLFRAGVPQGLRDEIGPGALNAGIKPSRIPFTFTRPARGHERQKLLPDSYIQLG